MRQLKISPSITHRDTHSLGLYLTDIGKNGLVTAEEEVILAQKIREGDQAALNRLTTANLRFVVSVSKQYQNMGLPLIDLIGEGNVGLIKAAKRFDETKGFKFISYAVWWIRQAIVTAIAEKSRVVRLPLSQIGLIKRLNRRSAELEQHLERAPSFEELSEVMELTASAIADINSRASPSISTDAPLHDQETTLLDLLHCGGPSTDHALIRQSMVSSVRNCLMNLPDKERQVIIMAFGINQHVPLSLEEIGQRMDLTQERIRQIRNKALLMLRNNKQNQSLKLYLHDPS